MSKSAKPTTKPTWSVKARPAGFIHGTWKVHHVTARSALQAEAILRRAGYETDRKSISRSEEPPSPVLPAAPEPVACANCGYVLDGLQMEKSKIKCPECAFQQVLVAWTDELYNTRQKTTPLVGCFAMIGLIATALMTLIFILALI